VRNFSRPLGFLLSSLVGIGSGAFARASPEPISSTPARIMIRGTGNSISVERSDAGSPRLLSRGGSRSTVLEEAVDMKAGGTADAALVGYLKIHAGEIPGFVDFDTVARLRDAGAGRTVIAYLATVSAVEIGPTGAAGGAREEPPESASPAESAMSNELPASLAYGGFVVGGGPGARMMRGHGARRGGIFFPPRARGARPAVPAPMIFPPPRFGRR
jgi:hypothetical protein